MRGAEQSIGESLHDVLSQLRLLPSASAGAAFELGLPQFRTVATDPMALLVEVRRNLANAEAVDEAGGDAAVYGTGIDAVMPAWLDAWPMIDALLDAYALDRAVIPVPGAVDPNGFALVVRPAIESSLRGRGTLLVQFPCYPQ